MPWQRPDSVADPGRAVRHHAPRSGPAEWRGQLERGLASLGLRLDKGQCDRLLAYLDLLTRWNRTYNLTAVRDPREMVARQLLDSLAVRPWLYGQRVLDLGTGAGLPGIPLAIAEPERAFTLIDSSGKKTRFVRQAIIQLGLVNAETVQTRAEDFRPDTLFDTITARALASLAKLWTMARPLLAPKGRVLALKGLRPEAELVAVARLAPRVEDLEIPGVKGSRCLVILQAPVN
jgi:16S rRNA (guanine527-N7)-methyltransferase